MKRNRESKARQRIICSFHLDKQGQRDLDTYVINNGIRYSDFSSIAKREVWPFLTCSNIRRAYKRIAMTTTKVIRQIGDAVQTLWDKGCFEGWGLEDGEDN